MNIIKIQIPGKDPVYFTSLKKAAKYLNKSVWTLYGYKLPKIIPGTDTTISRIKIN